MKVRIVKAFAFSLLVLVDSQSTIFGGILRVDYLREIAKHASRRTRQTRTDLQVLFFETFQW